ncbi:MAG: hypothetical protein PT120_13555 [Aphanizomenon gracile PMC649.10]|jgi:tRNA(fMet)-specific endonuclease VapC|nr:hypothetical protein [Aphanizomenon gracile PMC638.10]MDM3855887.1 hypothetical protein [Aphanizomenon gracile PMC649.10]MDM3858446.1 hypothetical protein [Aphanizomenon gracile PMC644.10]
MYLLDTDTLTHLHAGNSNVVKQLNTVEDDLIAITIITKIEVLRGRIDYVLKADTGEKLIKCYFSNKKPASFSTNTWDKSC